MVRFYNAACGGRSAILDDHSGREGVCRKIRAMIRGFERALQITEPNEVGLNLPGNALTLTK